MKTKKKFKKTSYRVHPDSHMYFGGNDVDRIIGDEYFSVDI